MGQPALIASGLALFVITLVVNLAARAVDLTELARSKGRQSREQFGRGRTGRRARFRARCVRRLASAVVDGRARVFVYLSPPLAVMRSLLLTPRKGSPISADGFLTHTMGIVQPNQPGGGIYHAIIGTLEQVSWPPLMAVPLGFRPHLHVEYGRGRLRTAIRFFVDVITGIPSIVAGLFGQQLLLLAGWIEL